MNNTANSQWIELQPWAEIPENLRRGHGDSREVFGETFLGDPIWLPYMGES